MTISSTTLKSCGASAWEIFCAPAMESMIESPWKTATIQRMNQRKRAMPRPMTRPPPLGAMAWPSRPPSAISRTAIPATMTRVRRRLLSIASHMTQPFASPGARSGWARASGSLGMPGADGRGARGDDALERALLVLRVALDRLHEVGDQVVAALELHVDLGPRVLGLVPAADQAVVHPGHRQDEDDDEQSDPERDDCD